MDITAPSCDIEVWQESRCTGLQGAPDAYVDSAEAAVPSEGRLAGWRRQRTMPQYTAARGRLDHTTISGAGRRVSPTLGIRSQATTCQPTNKARAGLPGYCIDL